MDRDKDLGMIAYGAYAEKSGGRSLVTGDPLPGWLQMPMVIQDAWTAAAAAVAASVRRENADNG